MERSQLRSGGVAGGHSARSHARRRSRRAGVVLAAAALGLPCVAGGTDQWAISIGVRETGSSGAVGSNGGATGGIEWINVDGQTISADDTWHQYTWTFGTDSVMNFSGGNGILSAANNKGVLEHIRIRNIGGNSGGDIRLRIDDIVNNTSASGAITLTGFETGQVNPNGGAPLTFSGGINDTYMFREPVYSGSTVGNMSTGLNQTYTSTIAHTGTRSLAARWTFVPNGSTSQWLRLTTNDADTLPNPIVDFTSGNTLSIWMRMSVYNPTGTRVRGVDVSSNQGSTIDWNKVAESASTGGGGLSFAFARATRGGTSGTSSTGSMRLDDTAYSWNATHAKPAGLLMGSYHFLRWDTWTPLAGSSGLSDSASTVGTPEDEARHFLEKAGPYVKPGYMRPAMDFEDPNGTTADPTQTNTELTNYILRVNNTLVKYKGPSAAIIIYAGQSYGARLNSGVSQFPLWRPAWPGEPDWAEDDPSTSESSYGPWNGPGVDNPLPWKFWQYDAPDNYIPGINTPSGLTHNDVDVAHGDLNYVKQYLVQGAIWDGSSSATWTTASNWDTNTQPTSTTEVLFDLGIPGTGATITLSSGRSASGIYFADSYTLSGGSLTLNDGRIDVDSTKTASIQTSLSAPNGFRKVGVGTMTHSSGTSTVTGTAQVLQGTMNVSGGSIAVSGNLLVDPELTQYDKGAVAPTPSLAGQITSGTLTINGGTVTAAAAYVGGTDTASGAIGTLNLSSGSLTVSGALKIWNSTVPLVDSKVNLSGGTLSVGSLDTNGNTAGFNWTAGTFAVTGAGGLSVSASGPVGSTLTVGTGKTLNVTNTLTVGSGSTVTLQNTGAISVGALDTSADPTRFNWTGGTLSVTGAGGLGVSASGPLGSTLTVGTGKTLNVTNALTVGSSSQVNLQNTGTISVGTLDTGGTPTRLNWTGGTFTHNGPGTSDLGTRTLGGATAQTLNVNGGTVTGTLTNSSLGTISVNAGGTLGAPVSNDGAMSVNGGTITSSVVSNGTLTVGAGTSTFGVAATVDNAGVININSPANVAFNAGVAGAGTITVASGATMTTAALASGTLTVNGSLTVNPNAPTGLVVVNNLAASGTFDVKNNKLMVQSTPIGAWNGSAYTDVIGMLAGHKITSSATTPLLTQLAIANASDTGKTTFAGVSLTGNETLIMYTWAGDANLSGFVDADDYFQLDAHYGQTSDAAKSFFNGDFDLDGSFDPDDYAIIDSGYSGQDLPISGGAPLGVTEVPEPSGVVVVMLGAASMCRRRRYRPELPGT